MNGNSVVVRHPSTEMIRDAFMSISLMRKGRLNSRSFCLYCNNSSFIFSQKFLLYRVVLYKIMFIFVF